MIIGLFGARNAGKDTVANVLAGHHGFVSTSFADPMYKEVAAAFGVSVEFLQKRETKETPLPGLVLRKCNDYRFILAVANEEQVAPTNAFLDIPRSPREIMQYWGTQYRRKQHGDDYWRTQVEKLINSNPDKSFCISDVRFASEAKMIEKMGGLLWKISRPGQEVNDDRSKHESEREMANYQADILIENSGTIDDISIKVDCALGDLCKPKNKKRRR